MVETVDVELAVLENTATALEEQCELVVAVVPENTSRPWMVEV